MAAASFSCTATDFHGFLMGDSLCLKSVVAWSLCSDIEIGQEACFSISPFFYTIEDAWSVGGHGPPYVHR